MSDRRDSLDRKLRFKREIAEALRLGAKRSDVAEVVRVFVGDREADPVELRRELQRLVPAAARFRDDELTGDLPVTDGPSSSSPVTRPRVAGLPSFPKAA